MPFLRFSRDKRGVEHFSLVQATANRRGKVRPRVLYWYRSPPDVKVGREPFDPDVRRALERQHPDVTFDWKSILETPIPSADADKWRERRRAERAAKHAAREEEASEAAEADAEPSAAAEAPVQTALTSESVPEDRVQIPIAAAPGAEVRNSTSAPANPLKRRRRRRSGGRGGNPPAAARPPSTPPSGGGEPSGD